MASSPWSGRIDPVHAASVPVYPVPGAPSGVAEAKPIDGLGVKAASRAFRLYAARTSLPCNLVTP